MSKALQILTKSVHNISKKFFVRFCIFMGTENTLPLRLGTGDSLSCYGQEMSEMLSRQTTAGIRARDPSIASLSTGTNLWGTEFGLRILFSRRYLRANTSSLFPAIAVTNVYVIYFLFSTAFFQTVITARMGDLIFFFLRKEENHLSPILSCSILDSNFSKNLHCSLNSRKHFKFCNF